jgi:hypothetical protein
MTEICFPDYYLSRQHLAKMHTSIPTGKVPVKYCGVSVYSSCVDHDDGKAYYYNVRVMPSGTLVFEMKVEYYDPISGEVLSSHTKVRVAQNREDLWSTASDPREVNQLTTILQKCGELLANDSTYFYRIIEDEPVPF